MALQALTVVTMELIAQIALGVIIGGLTIALLVIGFFVWNSRQRNERLAVGLFIAGAVVVVALLVVVVEASH
jgi:zinc transporter ZupT